MKESTAGTILTNSASAVVTGTGTLFTEMRSGDYVRIDAFGIGEDSEWYKIENIATDTNMTLSKVFRADTDATTTKYVISSATEIPYKFQDALISGSMRSIIVDQNDQNFIYYNMKFAQTLTDGKVTYNMRRSKDQVELIAENIRYRR